MDDHLVAGGYICLIVFVCLLSAKMVIGEPSGSIVLINNLDGRNKFSFVDSTCLKTAYSKSDVLSAKWDSLKALMIREFDALTKLPKCPIRSALLTKDSLLEVKDAYTTVSREESHRGISESFGVSEYMLNATSFVAKSFNNNRKSFNNSNNNTRGSYTNGANQHLTISTVGMYNIVDITSVIITVGHLNETLATISHVRNLKLSNNVILYEDLRKEIILGTGSETDGLYVFDMIKDASVGKSNMVMCFHVSKLLWHNRLGHPSDQVLYVLHNDLDISKSSFIFVCEVCHRAKQTRDPFPLSDYKSMLNK
ncbi:ribonuclease H-like domain-containing protein [Tanacetum coccineum]